MNSPLPHDSIFRRQALDRQTEQESIDALPRVTAPHEWIIAAGLTVLLIVFLAWGIWGRIGTNLQVGGVLAKAGERGVIVSTVTGRVVDLPVKPGEMIAAGAVVAIIEPAALERRLRLIEDQEKMLVDTTGQENESDPPLRDVRAERLEHDALRESVSKVVSARNAEITALMVGVGETVTAGMLIAQVRFEGEGLPEAVAFLDVAQAQPLQPGMGVSIRFQTTEGETMGALEGELSAISEPRTLPIWLAVTSVGTSSPSERLGRLARFTIADTDPSQFPDLTPVRLEINLGESAPIKLLGLR